jgi:hypothetical protein
MVNNDILGGLKSALTRGYTLEEAMLSFFNAGYKREDIQEAAKALQSTIAIQPKIELQPKPIWEPPKKKIQEPLPPFKPELKTRIPVSQVQVQAPVVSKPIVQKPIEQKVIVKEKEPIATPIKQPEVSKVSTYTGKSRIKTITIILVVLLAILLGILGLMYAFRSQIISFFNSIFS